MNELNVTDFISLLGKYNNNLKLDSKAFVGNFHIIPDRTSITVSNSLVNGIFEFISNSETWLVLEFIDTIFTKDLIIDIGNSKQVELNFTNCEFNVGFKIRNKGNSVKLNCIKCKWKNKIDISKCSFNYLKFTECSLIKENNTTENNTELFVANKITCQGEVILNNSELGGANFDGSIFIEHAKFDKSVFSFSSFINAEFIKDAYFNTVEFGKYCFFNGTSVNSVHVDPLFRDVDPSAKQAISVRAL